VDSNAPAVHKLIVFIDIIFFGKHDVESAVEATVVSMIADADMNTN